MDGRPVERPQQCRGQHQSGLPCRRPQPATVGTRRRDPPRQTRKPSWAAPKSTRRIRSPWGRAECRCRSCPSRPATIWSSVKGVLRTNESISFRIAREALFRDSATLSPLQTGHATRFEMSSIRSSWLCGPDARVEPTARTDTMTTRSSTQPGQPFILLLISLNPNSCGVGLAQLLHRHVQSFFGHSRNDPHLHDTTGVDDPGLGNERHAEGHSICSCSSTTGQSPPRSAKNSSTSSRAVIDHDRVELCAVGAQCILVVNKRDQIGVLGNAGRAVGAKEVDDHPAPLALRQIELGAVEQRADRLRCRSAEQRRFCVSPPPGRADQQNEQTDHRPPRCRARSRGPPRGADRR